MTLRCDFCGELLRESEMITHQGSEIVACEIHGFVPSRMAPETEKLLSLTGADRREFWKKTVWDNKLLAWGLCGQCEADLQRFIEGGAPEPVLPGPISTYRMPPAQKPESTPNSRLLKGITHKDADLVAAALSDGADPNATFAGSKLVIHVAALAGRADIVGMLLEAGANPQSKFKGAAPRELVEAAIATSGSGGDGPPKAALEETLLLFKPAADMPPSDGTDSGLTPSEAGATTSARSKQPGRAVSQDEKRRRKETGRKAVQEAQARARPWWKFWD